MSDNSLIEWTDATWSPTLGCTKVSEGCDHCYAMRTVHRMSFNPNEKIWSAAEGLTENRPGVGVVWTNVVRTLPGRLNLPLHWTKPRRIFVDSQSDLFHDAVPDDFIAQVFMVMAQTPRHTYQILTKRPGRMRSLLRRWTPVTGAPPWVHTGPWPLPNVWLGVSVEDQHWADVRIPILLETPAAVRWISAEPLIGPVDVGIGDPHRGHKYFHISDYRLGCLDCSPEDEDVPYFRREKPESGGWGIDWVVCGGESGAGARPMHPGWARSLRDQCASADVPFLFKQWGDWAPHDVARPTAAQLNAHGTHWDGTAAATARVGKQRAGRRLDGRIHDEYPAVSR